jgi:hypothetical protein
MANAEKSQEFRMGICKEKGGIREEVDAADYSGSVQGGGEN